MFDLIADTYSTMGAWEETDQTKFRLIVNGDITFLSLTLSDYTTTPPSLLTVTPWCISPVTASSRRNEWQTRKGV
jgi:hypothetical protein